MHDVWFLCLNLSYGIYYASSNFFYARVISFETTYGIFLDVRVSVKRNRYNIYAVASMLVVLHDIASPCSYAAANDIWRVKVWRAEKYFH